MPDNPQRPPKRSSGPVIIISIIILVGLLYMGWSYFSGNLPWQQHQEDGAPKISWLEKGGGEQKPVQQDKTIFPNDKEQASLHLAPGEAQVLNGAETSGQEQKTPEPPNECFQTADKLLLFFEHLDRQDYIREYNLKGSSLEHINGIINKLMANPPVVVRETDDLFAILNNMAHFFRVLGPRDILFIKDVLVHELELVESTMALFYKWSEIEPECSDNELNIKLPLTGLYEYAGYFINTLGGQSYLFRRALYLRILIRYYSILIIDQSNSEDVNRYGIDIRYTLDALISEIQSNGDLKKRQDYLDILLRMQESYQAKYGSK